MQTHLTGTLFSQCFLGLGDYTDKSSRTHSPEFLALIVSGKEIGSQQIQPFNPHPTQKILERFESSLTSAASAFVPGSRDREANLLHPFLIWNGFNSLPTGHSSVTITDRHRVTVPLGASCLIAQQPLRTLPHTLCLE